MNRKKAKVDELLNEALQGRNLKYELSDNYIILSPLTKSEKDQQTGRVISGIVKDRKGEPVIGANVMEKGTTNGIITDSEGRFYSESLFECSIDHIFLLDIGQLK